ncbi:hypothetical protein LSAT2_014108, partial [Lamellibrachia satsuma]
MAVAVAWVKRVWAFGEIVAVAVAVTAPVFSEECSRMIKTKQDSQILQDVLNKLEAWEKDWNMSFNLSKCDNIIITRHHPREVVEKLATGTGMGREDPIETDDEANQPLEA